VSALDDMDTEAIATADSNRLVFPSSAAYFDAAIPMRRRSADEGRPWFGCLPIHLQSVMFGMSDTDATRWI